MGNRHERDWEVYIGCVLSNSMDRDSAFHLAQNDEFYHAVMKDIAETSAYSETGEFSDGDLKLAIGRVIGKKFGVMY